MEPATIVQLPTGNGAAASGGTAAPAASGATIVVDGERILVTDLVLVDHALATFVASREADEREALVARALRIGLTALQDVGVTVNVDVVRAEFEKIVSQTTTLNAKAAEALDRTLRDNFSDGDGRLPKTLERFLGDRGELQRFVNDLFDESKRDSAVGRMKLLLGNYFDGDQSKLAQLLDPTRMGSPLHQFRIEINQGFKELNEKIVGLQEAQKAKAAERAKSAAKGNDFEDLLEPMLGEICRGLGDTVERTGTVAGDAIRSKKGDFVITVAQGLTRGQELRVVIESKNKGGMSQREIAAELRAAKENRGAAMAVIVFSPGHAPTGVAPFDIRHGDVYCVIDPEDPDKAVLEAAVRLARFHAIATLTDDEVEIDTEAIRDALNGIREQLGLVQSMKVALTSINNGTKEVYSKLETLREGIVTRIAKAEAELNTKS